MGVSAAYGPIFLWLQHPSAQQHSVTHSSRSSPSRTTLREPNQGWGARDLRLRGRHTERSSPHRVCSSCWLVPCHW